MIEPSAGGDTEANLTLEEKLRRERARQLTTGITSFSHVADTNKIVYPQQGNVMVVNIDGGSPALLFDKQSTGATGGVIDPKPSPDGSAVAFVQDGELYAVATAGSAAPAQAIQLTCGARQKGWTNGLADYIAMEEFDRQTGFWWSPCGRYIAFQQTDETHIPQFTISHAGAEDPAQQEVHRYPFAGQRNAVVRLGVIDVKAFLASNPAPAVVGAGVKGKEAEVSVPAPVWLHLGADDDIYLGRVDWIPTAAADGAPVPPSSIAVQIINREQSVLDLVRFDLPSAFPSPTGTTSAGAAAGAASISGHLLLRESQPNAWINVHDMCHFLPPGVVPTYSRLRSGSSSGEAAIDGGGIDGNLRGNAFTTPAKGTGPSSPTARGSSSSAHFGTPSIMTPSTPASYHLAPGQQPPCYFIWASERSGFMHLYLFSCPSDAGAYVTSPAYTGPPTRAAASASGDGASEETAPAAGLATPIRRITGGQWVVETLVHVGMSQGQYHAFFSGTLDGPLERHFYSAPVFGPSNLPGNSSSNSGDRGEEDAEGVSAAIAFESIYGIPGCRRLTSGAGLHTVVMAADSSHFVDTLSCLHGPPSLAVYKFDPAARFPGTSPRAATAAVNLTSSLTAAASATVTSPSGASIKFTSPMDTASANNSRSAIPTSSSSTGSVPVSRLAAVGLEDDREAPWPVRSMISFERTGAYGPRMSVGVSLIAVAHNSLPSCSGTPPQYGQYKAQLHKAMGLLTPSGASGSASARGGRGRKGSSGLESDFAAIAQSASAAVTNIADSIRSGFSDFTAAIKDKTADMKTNININAKKARSESNATSAIGAGALEVAAGTTEPSAAAPSAEAAGSAASTTTPSSKFSLDTIGSKLSLFGIQAGAMLAGIALPKDKDMASAFGKDADAVNLADTPVSEPASAAGATGDVDATAQSPASAAAAAPEVTIASPSAPTPVPQVPVAPVAAAASATTVTASAVTLGSAASPPLLVSLPAADGVSTMYAAIFLPDPAVHGYGPYPTVISVSEACCALRLLILLTPLANGALKTSFHSIAVMLSSAVLSSPAIRWSRLLTLCHHHNCCHRCRCMEAHTCSA